MRKNHLKKFFICGLALLLVGGAAGLLRVPGRTRTVWSPVRMRDRQLILDAGHGGEDGGAVSVSGVPESNINLAVVLRIDQLLGFCGVSPILIRDKDISVYDAGCNTLREKKVSDLHNRVSLIEGTENALVVSVHQNTFSNAAYHGAQVFYREGEESLALAEAIQNALREGLDPDNGREPTRIPSSVYLMAHITCPAVLVECGFLSNPEEEAKLMTEEYQIQLAVCMTSALLESKQNTGLSDKPVI